MKSNRRKFIKQSLIAGAVLGLHSVPLRIISDPPEDVMRIGIIGLDTSHSTAFTEILNAENPEPGLTGFKVIAAYPYGSSEIPSSVELIPNNIKQFQQMGIEIVDSIKTLMGKVDAVFLETNDGRLHLEQAREVYRYKKPVFVDKPLSASLSDAIKIFQEAEASKVPVFSSSSLRYLKNAQNVRYQETIGHVLGADTFSPATLEPHHPDFFWYGIHGVETLYTVMGPGCDTVSRFSADNSDIAVGKWKDGRFGTFRGMRKGTHDYGGIAFGTIGNTDLGPYEGFKELLVKVTEFFRTGISPVDYHETLEIYGFMAAADESKRKDGLPVSIDEVLKEAGYRNNTK